MYYLVHIPLYLYLGLVVVWQRVQLLPWPSATEWFRWFIFLLLGKLVWYVISQLFNRRNGSSTNSAAAIVSSLFDRH